MNDTIVLKMCAFCAKPVTKDNLAKLVRPVWRKYEIVDTIMFCNSTCKENYDG